MKQQYMSVLFAIIYIFGYINALPLEKPPNYTNHKNYNLLPSKCGDNDNALEDKIFAGTETNLGEFPWMVRLKYQHIPNPVFRCAGSLINARYIVTAAHCFNANTKILQVRLGEHDERTDPDTVMIDEENKEIADPVVDVDIEEIVQHENYSPITKHNDIALIRLKRNITFTKYIGPVCLPLNGESAQTGQKLYVAGWGLTENNITSPVKLKVKVPVTTQEHCSAVFKSAKRDIIPSQICAGSEKGRDSCRGDSGGPLLNSFDPNIEKYYLEGIVSFGTKECGRRAVPGIYTRVSHFVDWILDTMKPF